MHGPLNVKCHLTYHVHETQTAFYSKILLCCCR